MLTQSECYKIAAILQAEVGKKFGDAWKISIGGYLFLRLFCPAIFLPPEEFNVNFESVPPQAKRTLVIVSKILQNLANLQSKFGEDSMHHFTSFVQSKLSLVEDYYEHMAIIPADRKPSKSVTVNTTNVIKDILKLMSSVEQRLMPMVTKNNMKFVQLWSFTQRPKLESLVSRLSKLKLPYQQDNLDVKDFLFVSSRKPHAYTSSLCWKIPICFTPSKK